MGGQVSSGFTMQFRNEELVLWAMLEVKVI